jgi:hypothetical protein
MADGLIAFIADGLVAAGLESEFSTGAKPPAALPIPICDNRSIIFSFSLFCSARRASSLAAASGSEPEAAACTRVGWVVCVWPASTSSAGLVMVAEMVDTADALALSAATATGVACDGIPPISDSTISFCRS